MHASVQPLPFGRTLTFRLGCHFALFRNRPLDWRTHMPAGSDGTRPTARSKGKVERPFRTVKEAHETLYHFHKPETEAEANAWLSNFVVKCNEKPHRREPHSRLEDWIANLPESGFREMCSWERFCAFAREPERRKVGSDAHISIQGVRYEVDPELAGEEAVLWWGLFDHELFVEWRDKRFGPYRPSGGPIPLHRYRKRRKSAREKRAETVAALAAQLSIPRSAVSGHTEIGPSADIVALPRSPFIDPDPWGEIAYRNDLEARRGIADRLAPCSSAHQLPRPLRLHASRGRRPRRTPASARPQFRIGLLQRLMSVDRSSRTHGPTPARGRGARSSG